VEGPGVKKRRHFVGVIAKFIRRFTSESLLWILQIKPFRSYADQCIEGAPILGVSHTEGDFGSRWARIKTVILKAVNQSYCETSGFRIFPIGTPDQANQAIDRKKFLV
jgi:hypothetical protein